MKVSDKFHINIIKKYALGCKRIDDLLGGGFESGTVTQLYGEGGSGKTNICLQLSIECVKKGEKVIYIDTESISGERFEQIAGEDAEEIARDIIIYEPMSFEEQYASIKEVNEMMDGVNNVGLIVLDSATLFYRYELNEARSISLKRELAKQITNLLILARRHDIAVVITTQVYTDIERDELRPIGGNMLDHLSKVIVKLERLDGGRRKAVLKKHRSMPEGRSCDFVLCEDGVRDSSRFALIKRRISS
jgi:DNA repair protein RadB